MEIKQRTIKADVTLVGIGLHTGRKVNVVLKSATDNSGINFIRIDLPNNPIIKADPSNIYADTGIGRCTTIGRDDVVINTVEHLMSVLCGLGITNLIVEIDGEELPGLDGSGLEYWNAIQSVGLVEQKSKVDFFHIKEPIAVESGGSSICIFPSDEFKVSYTLDYNHPQLRSQFYSATITEDIYKNEIVQCRTFCLESESKSLQLEGLGKGANFTNTLVVGDSGVIDNEVRFPDEFARHKVLDLIGDLYLFGFPIRGHVFAIKSGHALNFSLLKNIYRQRERYLEKGIVSQCDFSRHNEITITDIMKILPHRYPFLLVDKVFEIELGKKAVGIKNVTINDGFFRGHFPTQPIMPGVLMIEAMAQTAGVVILTHTAHRGKVAFFMAVNNVKFRKVVVPGDQLMMEVEVIKSRSRIAQVRGIGKVDGAVVVEADMTFSFTDASYLDNK